MTDTVNVLRDAVAKAIRDAVGHCRMSVDMAEVAADAALAAAPKPVSDPYKFAAWVEEMTAKHGNPNGTDYEQGQNDMGVRIASRLRSIAAQPEAPKVEQEAVMVPEVFWSWLVERGLTPDDPDFDWNDIVEILNEHENELIHPAPVSDELLEALRDLTSWFEKPVQGLSGPVWAIPAGEQGADDAVEAAQNLIAKHKGPQS